MRRIMLILVIFIFIPLCHAQDSLFYESNYLVLDVDLSTSINIVSLSHSPEIDFITANISFFPKKMPGQQILSSDLNPHPEIIGDAALFEWKSPSQKKLSIDMDYKVKVEDKPIRIYKKIGFPLRDVPEEMADYIKPAEIIDINDDIISTASEIASGKDDTVDVVDSIAVWVNSNIEYNFSTVTSEASQKASWVLENREGVCDELTSLFIAMLRSLGIPARFVAGISYTNSPLLAYNWGPHGWAEVYFPGHGWVPYDVTYGEYGWTDPTHIISHISDDAGKVISNYQWRAEKGVSLDLEDIKTTVDVVEIGKRKEPDVSIDIDVLKSNVGFGSYNLVTASITNLNDYYVSKDIYIAATNRINNTDGMKRHVLLRPGEIKELHWIVQVDEGLDRDYIYTLPAVVYTLKNITAKTSFTSVEEAPAYSLGEMEKIISLLKKEDERAYSKNLEISCGFDKEEYYSYEKPLIQCSIKNVGNIFFKNLKMCLEDDCREFHLGITQEKRTNFTVKNVYEGENDLILSIENDQVSMIKHIVFEGLDEPELGITDVEFPLEARYNDDFQVQFRLKKESGSDPQDVEVRISGAGTDLRYDYASVDKDILYKIDLRGKDLNEGGNKIAIDIDYKDRNEKEYSASEEVNISLVDVTLFQKIMLFFRGIWR